MRTDLLGLELPRALELLRAEGLQPDITVTHAPRRARDEGVLRVVYASDGGERLTASPFLEPLTRKTEQM